MTLNEVNKFGSYSSFGIAKNKMMFQVYKLSAEVLANQVKEIEKINSTVMSHSPVSRTSNCSTMQKHQQIALIRQVSGNITCPRSHLSEIYHLGSGMVSNDSSISPVPLSLL